MSHHTWLPKQSVLYHQKFSCKSDFMFFVIPPWYFWCLVQLCLIFNGNFFMLQHEFHHIFWFVIFVFLLSFSVCEFSTTFNQFFFIFLSMNLIIFQYLQFWCNYFYVFCTMLESVSSFFFANINKGDISPYAKITISRRLPVSKMIFYHWKCFVNIYDVSQECSKCSVT